MNNTHRKRLPVRVGGPPFPPRMRSASDTKAKQCMKEYQRKSYKTTHRKRLRLRVHVWKPSRCVTRRIHKQKNSYCTYVQEENRGKQPSPRTENACRCTACQALPPPADAYSTASDTPATSREQGFRRTISKSSPTFSAASTARL